MILEDTMPGTIADIIKCSIDEDQLRVATQWTNTFIHNPPDTANNMAQLVMACVGRGDFKIRDLMSPHTELHAPSQHLSIADYLSHASRIIIDYNLLSDEHIQDLLAYFPEPSPSNNVVSRSATHAVSQVNDKAVEGKGFMLGVKGQLPSAIKTPRDFGVNIAMGGAGQNNLNGKKISANGFSGHFYFHRNTEHKLLLAGLEQSAPSSALSLLLGEKKYPEDEQQGHDQFGQGHSLTGASDTYTAAGSLYFSNPIYQAKLLLEKGVFPPAKYGAMQVTLTDDNWSLIKNFLKKLQATSQAGNTDELLGALLEKPLSAVEQKSVYTSYVTLDFNSYLKQAYKVFIHNSELEKEQKSSVLEIQVSLLSFIKELQFGNLAALPKFEELMKQLIALEHVPEEYKTALGRINELFARQLSTDPQLKNTQISRPYQVGDMTYQALNHINHLINGDGEKLNGYEFGDISWGILNRINQGKEGYQFGDITYALLSKFHQSINGDKQKYQFGAITSGLLSKFKSPATKEEPKEASVNQSKEYRFGDITRNLIWGNKQEKQPQEKQPQEKQPLEEEDLDSEWTKIEGPK